MKDPRRPREGEDSSSGCEQRASLGLTVLSDLHLEAWPQMTLDHADPVFILTTDIMFKYGFLKMFLF